MGCGGSKHLQIVQPRVNVTPFSNHPENPVYITAQPEVHEEQSSSDNGEDESKEDSSSQEDDEWDVLHTDKLTRYTINYPEEAEDFQQMFENVKVLRNTMNSSASDRYSAQLFVIFREISLICNDIDTSTGPVVRKDMRVLEFLVEIEAAELLQKFAENYFKGFYDMAGEQDNDKSSSEDESRKNCFLFLQRVLVTILNFADSHDGFCSASVRAGVVPMCLENILRLDHENNNWQSGEDKSFQLINLCLGILHNSRRFPTNV